MANSTINSNPWKGLNFYVEGEILYGRNSEIESLSQYIINNTQTVLYGKSGIGKSSILNAGIFPIARTHGLLPVAIRFDHTGIPYIEQIKTAINNSGAVVHEILPAIDEATESLWEYMHRNIFFDHENKRVQLLLVIDQFEEIFTLQQDEKAKRAFFNELADLINDITPLYIVNANKKHVQTSYDDIQEVAESLDNLDFDLDLDDATESSSTKSYLSKIDYHIVFTLREDFLSYLERYTAYIPAMKSNRYALMPINEEQAVDIIMKPKEGLITKEVAGLIIQKITGKTNFSLDSVPEIDVDAAVLSLYLSRLYIKKSPDEPTITAELVNQFSSDIIKDFYEESVGDLPANEIEKIEDQLLTYDGRRNNVSRNDLIKEGISEKVIKTLVEDRKLLRQFSYQDDIRLEYMHDILCPVINDRIDQRETAKRQAEEQKAQEEKQRKLLEEEQRKREAVEAQAKADRERMEEEARQQRSKNKLRLTLAFSLLLLGAIVWFTWFFFTRMTFTQNYASFTTKDGWPVGIGDKLRNADRGTTPVYYQLVRKGFYKDNTRVNILNWDKQLSQNVFEESPLVGLFETEGTDESARRFSLMQQQTAYWVYTPDNEGNAYRKTAYDKDGDELYSIQYFYSNVQGNSEKKQLWANFIDKDGKSLRVRDNGADRMRITMNNGYYSGFMFFSETGTPQSNFENAYGYRYELDGNGHVTRKDALDEFGEMLSSNGMTFLEFDSYGRWTKSSDGDANYSQESVVRTQNVQTDSLVFDNNGRLVYQSVTTKNNDYYRFQYDEGQVTSYLHYRLFDGAYRLLNQKTILQQQEGVYQSLAYHADSLFPYRMELREQMGNRLFVSYFGGDNQNAIVEPIVVFSTIGTYHKMIVDTVSEDGLIKKTTAYFDENDMPSQTCILNRDVAYYNERNEMVKHIVYFNDSICYAYLNDYDDGQIIAQSVLGLDGNAIRYPNWDINNLCYYKMKLIYNFSNTLVAIKGINEFGEESLITTPDLEEYSINVVPSTRMDDGSGPDEPCKTHGLQMYRESIQPIDKTKCVDYIRITDLEGAWHKAGVLDGDLLVQVDNHGQQIMVARANATTNSYDILRFTLPDGIAGAEHYPVYFSEKEINRYNKAISTLK